jgi:C4-dicarboxylate-specific signal transduction histidine kinase
MVRPINETIHDVIGLTSGEVQRHSVLLRTELARDLPRVRGDRVQLQQVLLNLIINAIDAMSAAGTGPRELTVVSSKDGSRGALVAVRDSGPGLDPQSSERLFNPFYTTKAEGLGMGLAISRSIIEAHGGRLSAGPNERRGAVFQFSLPAGGKAQEEHPPMDVRPGG